FARKPLRSGLDLAGQTTDHQPVTLIAEPPADVADVTAADPQFGAPAPECEPEIRPMWEQVVLFLFVLGPFAALGAAIGCGAAFGFAPSIVDVAIAVVFY